RQVLHGTAYASEHVVEIACVRYPEFFGEIGIRDRLAHLGLADEKRKSESCARLVKRFTSNRFCNPSGVARHNTTPIVRLLLAEFLTCFFVLWKIQGYRSICPKL